MAPSNALPMHGNDKTMNLNSLVLANIQASPYFKVHLYDLKTYHQVIDEIYYKVAHLEPWEKGSRKTAGQTGMCGGVRGVGTGGIVSSAFCLLFKLYTLKLTRKQLIGLCTHADSPYIRALGLMYIRFTQPPQDLWDWYEPYLDDDEEVDVKAGGGHIMTIGDMSTQMLTKLEWYSTLFPRIPVPIQKTIENNLRAHQAAKPRRNDDRRDGASGEGYASNEPSFGEAERLQRRFDDRYDSSSKRRSPSPHDVIDVDRERGGRHSTGRDEGRSRDRRSPERSRDSRRRSPDRHRRSRSPRRRSPDGKRHSRRRSSESKRGSEESKRSPEKRRRSRDRKRSSSPRERRHKHSKRSSSRERRHKNGSSRRHERSRSPREKRIDMRMTCRRSLKELGKQRKTNDRSAD